MSDLGDPVRVERQRRREYVKALTRQAFLEALVRFDEAGGMVLAASRDIAVRPMNPLPQGLPEGTTTYSMGVQVPDRLQLAVLHAWEDYLSAFYTVLNRYSGFLAAVADHQTHQRLAGVRMRDWLRRLSQLFPELRGDIGLLETARHHRSKWFDHQQVAGNALDWLTTQARTHALVVTVPVHLKVDPGPRKVIFNGGMVNPWQVGYMPPMENQGWGAPPCPICLARSLMTVIRTTSARFGHSWAELKDPAILSNVHDCHVPAEPRSAAEVGVGRWTCPDCGQKWQFWVKVETDNKTAQPFWREVDFWWRPTPPTNDGDHDPEEAS